MQTMAENVTKNIFPSLIKQLWDNSFKESHIISGFRAAGLHPLSRSAIKDSKLATGVPFQQPAKEPRTATTIVQASSPIVLRGSCKSCGAELTPILHGTSQNFYRKNTMKIHLKVKRE